MLKYFLLILIGLSLVKCVPADVEPITEVEVDLTSKEWQKAYNYKDLGKVDSLLQYTSHPDPAFRKMVADGLASIRELSAVDSLEKLLADPVMDVRVAAAYALGQLKNESVAPLLLKSFRSKDTLNVDNEYNGTILEAVGKTGGEGLLKNIATVSTYRSTDTLLLVGQARSIYRYALRGIAIPEGTDKMISFLLDENIPPRVKIIAANYLQRAKNIDLGDSKFQLAEVFASDKDPYVRMALATAIGRTADKDVETTLLAQLESEEDYRVKCNIIRALSSFPYIRIIEPILNQLGDENRHVAITAANFLIENGNKNDAVVYRGYLNDTLHYSVNAKIYAAVLKHIPVFYTNTKNIIKGQLLEKYEATNDVYEKSEYLKAISQDPYNYITISELLDKTNSPVLKSNGVEGLYTILKSENFVRAHRSRSRRVKSEIIDILKREIAKGDAGAVAVAGNVLADDKLDMKALIDSTQFLSTALGKLNLPDEIESYNSLKAAKDYINGVPHNPTVPAVNHPIDYAVFEVFGDSSVAALKTDRGVIKVSLYSEAAPGSVANFINLAESDYYNGKVFHRVVPNFVVQAGCSRGDGYGSLDYTIRSEVSQMYYNDEGYIGMASAGPDTEGTQWFITHSPTMHLDGNYTIFGKVISGMEYVHDTQVGDKIQEVIITNN